MEIPDGSLAWALQKIQHKARHRRDILVFLKWLIMVSLICISNLLPCAIFPSKCKYASSSINSSVAIFSWERPYKASKAIFKDCFRKRHKLNLWFSLQETCDSQWQLTTAATKNTGYTVYLNQNKSPTLYHQNFYELCAACKETQNWINTAHGCQSFRLYKLFHTR